MDPSKMTMSELRRTGKQLHIRGTTCYKKFNESNRAMLETKIRDRVGVPSEEIVLWDKPLQFLRDAIRKSGLKITSDILRRSMMQFRSNFIEIGDVDPFRYVTIASVCMAIYRSQFMPLKQIAVVKDTKRIESFSEISIKWLMYVSNNNIQHALNGGEYTVEGVGRVDGFCAGTNTVYEFQGCLWHGCPKCYNEATINTRNQIDMGELNKRTLAKNAKIQALGFNLVTIYECELKEDTLFKKWSSENPIEFVGPLDPRDAFFGGRTNVSKLKYDFKEGEKGRYVDFVSLYPTVHFSKTYPIGHPTKLKDPKALDRSWFGFIKCKVEAPRGLYHPVLPVRTKCGKDEKLLFSLCRTCAETQSTKTCNHNSKKRSFIGTWCSNKYFRAVDQGYKVHRIFEVWHFEETSDDLFKGYVEKFMKIKMENSKLSSTQKSVDEFKRTVKNKLGIELGEIKFNPGMRAIAKLCLNSLWGKFGQRVNMTQTRYVTEPKEFYKILLDDAIDDLNILFINEDMVQMNYNLKDQFVDNHNNTNIFVAAFTTSHAREMLYGVLDKLGDQVLGYDTDSCWYADRKGGNTIETGDSLGDLTDELEGDYIVEWSGTGPKSYAYTTNKGKEVCKVKGFTLNYANCRLINQSTMSKLVDGSLENVTTTRKNAITRSVLTKELVNKDQTKTFECGYNKRVVQANYDTLPYGY